MLLNFLAPAPYAQFDIHGNTYQADGNGLIYSVSDGRAAASLVYSGCIPLVANPSSNFRNLLDGGDFGVNPWQRNIAGLASSNVIASAIADTLTYFPDRWFAVGGATSAILMAKAADTTIPGFSSSLLLTRQAGNADTAAIKLGSVIGSADSVKAQGQYLTLSFWTRAAANYSGGALGVKLISGTGSNQSAANIVAGSWTNQANLVNTTQAINGSMTRYSFTTSAPVPANVTQLGALFSFTPTGTAGTTDGLYANGFQLELGTQASPFEHRSLANESDRCQLCAHVIPEPAAAIVAAGGATAAADNQNFVIPLPRVMWKAPTVSVAAGSFKVAAGTTAGNATGFAAGSAHTAGRITVVSALTQTAGGVAHLVGAGGSGYILASADF